MNKFNDLKLYRGATSVIELDFTGFDFAENSKCQLTIEKKYNNHVIYQHDFDKPIKYYITFKDEFTANLDDDKYKYDIMYMLNDERYPQCEISDIYMEEVINNYNGEVNPDAVEVTEVLTDGVEVNDTIKINNSNIVIINSKLQEISIIPTKEEQVILPQEDYDGISKVIVEKISDEYIIPTGTKEITSNGVHNVAEFESANINVNPNLEEGSATPTKEEQVITPNEEYDGFSKVTLNPIPDEYIIPNGILDIKANGTHDVTEKSSVNVDVQPSLQDKKVTVKPSDNIYVMPDEDYYGLAVVNVVGAVDTENVEVTPTKEVQTINRSEDKYIESVIVNAIPDEYIVPSGELEITANGQYDVTDKASVNVEIASGSDISEYFNTEPITGGSSGAIPWLKTVKKIPAYTNTGTSCDFMFSNFKGENIDLTNIDTTNVTSMESMFSGCSGVANLDLSNFDTSKVTKMQSMFSGCSSLTSLDLSGFNTEKVTNMYNMFYQCSNLTSLDLSDWNVSNVTSMWSMFTGCNNLISLDLSGWQVLKGKSIYNMFVGCDNLKNLNLTNFVIPTSDGVNIKELFSGCKNLTSLDLSSFDFSGVNSQSYMFKDCTALTNLIYGTNMGKAFTNKSTVVAYRVDFSTCPNLTHDSLMDIINKLYDLNLTFDVANGGTIYNHPLILGATNLAKLTEEEIAIATTKGWTVS